MSKEDFISWQLMKSRKRRTKNIPSGVLIDRKSSKDYICITVMHILGATLQATLNVRMDSIAKERGDRVLKDHGMSTSEAIRSLWHYLASEKKLPDFMLKDLPENSEKAQRLAAARRLCGIAKGPLSGCSDEELKEIACSKYDL